MYRKLGVVPFDYCTLHRLRVTLDETIENTGLRTDTSPMWKMMTILIIKE